MQRLRVGGGINAQSSGFFAGVACLATNPVSGLCTGGNAQFEFEQPGFTVVALRASYDVTPKWQLALNLNNVLDKTYWPTVANTNSENYYGEPKNFALILRGRF